MAHSRHIARALLKAHDKAENKASMGVPGFNIVCGRGRGVGLDYRYYVPDMSDSLLVLSVVRDSVAFSAFCLQHEFATSVHIAEVITYRFLNEAGTHRRAWEGWAHGTDSMMNLPMYNELLAYSTSLVAMQRLESRHSILRRCLSFRGRMLPDTVSATVRRLQNQDLQKQDFQDLLPDLLSSIAELYDGSWRSKTELLTRMRQASAVAVHSPLSDLKKLKERFGEQLALRAASSSVAAQQRSEGQLTLFREHVRGILKPGQCYALRGCFKPGVWSVFRVVSVNPGSIMTMQKATHLSHDVARLHGCARAVSRVTLA